MKKLMLTTAILALSFTAALAADIRIGSSADYPPWESVDASGNIVGFDRDVGDEICKRISANCTWTNQAFDGLLPSLQVGKFDLVISGISINEERSKQVDFSVAYADAPNNLSALADSEAAKATDRAALEKALVGKVIGVQTGSTHEQVAKAHFKDSEVRIYDRPDQVLDDIIAGRIDAGLMEKSAWLPLLKTEKAKDKVIFAGPQLTSADYPEFGKGQGIAIRKGQDELKASIDKAVADMLADGTMAKISQKWFEYDVSKK
ncbi:MAG TPA: transporter substrate-binding domain-containing protein [Pararhizobium sp.]|uniref:transporter substrate-binding domain-containing protein n=1 Tax=Pararhizobium sp. TaxID=1977563 RepID=UPI002B58F993|nr:transporter substrate-binding domain-containing protein [Pararhizobium sp.]HTO31523.1 transporter substrate-binding domain-containing protein [Pararhizobium sp.]